MSHFYTNAPRWGVRRMQSHPWNIDRNEHVDQVLLRSFYSEQRVPVPDVEPQPILDHKLGLCLPVDRFLADLHLSLPLTP
jgi:hypothetical protein